MATLFVDHTGSNTSPYDTWTKAATTLATAAGAAAAGDTIYVANTHSETTAGAVTITFTNATTTLPIYVYCAVPVRTGGDNTVSALATGAVVAATGANNISVEKSSSFYGITFSAGGGSSSTARIRLGSTTAVQSFVFDNCVFTIATTESGANSYCQIGSTSQNQFKINACTFNFGAGSQRIYVNSGAVRIDGSRVGTHYAGSTLFLANAASTLWVSGFDATNMAASSSLLTQNSGFGSEAYFRNIKLPASWSGAFCPAITAGMVGTADMHNGDYLDTNYNVNRATYTGNLTQDTGIYLDGGITDGTTPLSWKVVTTANADWHRTFTTPELAIWNEATGSAKTVSVEVLYDGATALTDAECWLEVMSLSTSGVPLGTWTSDRAADILATPATQATSTATWTGDTGTGPNGSTTWNRQKLSVSVTPQEKGTIIGRVVFAVASKTIYVDPVLTVA